LFIHNHAAYSEEESRDLNGFQRQFKADTRLMFPSTEGLTGVVVRSLKPVWTNNFESIKSKFIG
jgi:hypothetical protein